MEVAILKGERRMRSSEYHKIKESVIERGYLREIEWCEHKKPCENSIDFLCEYIWVVVNSGMKNQVAEKIYQKVLEALRKGTQVPTVFRHRGKVAAILKMWLEHPDTFKRYQEAEDKIIFLERLPWIGKITKFHLARNLGMDVCKPDRHLVRIAAKYNTTPDELCRRLSKETGDRIGTVDVVLWRAANLGLI